MKLIVFCLLTVCWFSLASTNQTRSLRKLQQILHDLKMMEKSVQNKEQMVNTPPQNIEECCALPALKCFKDELNTIQLNLPKRHHNKFSKSLQHPLTENGLLSAERRDFCNNTNTVTACGECSSHPKETTQEFFNRLKSFIEMGISRLSMK